MLIQKCLNVIDVRLSLLSVPAETSPKDDVSRNGQAGTWYGSYRRLRTATNDAVRSSAAHTQQPAPQVDDDEDDDEEDEKGKPGSGGGNIDPDDDEGFSDDDEDDDDDETMWSVDAQRRFLK